MDFHLLVGKTPTLYAGLCRGEFSCWGKSNLGLKSGFCPILAGHAQATYLISYYLNLLIY